MAEENSKTINFKIGGVPVKLITDGKRVLGGIINNKTKFEVVKEYKLALKFDSYSRDIPKENFLDLYKRIGEEIRKLKGIKPKTTGAMAARKSKTKTNAKKRGAARKRCSSKKK